MKKIRFVIKREDISLDQDVQAQTFEYSYESSIPFNELLDLFNKIWDDIQIGVSKFRSSKGYEILINWPLKSDDPEMDILLGAYLNNAKALKEA
jgi:hypothetical protein